MISFLTLLSLVFQTVRKVMLCAAECIVKLFNQFKKNVRSRIQTTDGIKLYFPR